MEFYREDGKKLRKKDKDIYFLSPSDNETLKKVPTMFDPLVDIKKFIFVCMKSSFPEIKQKDLENLWEEAYKKNEIVINAIEELKKESETSGSIWKARAYAKAFKTLKTLKIPIVSGTQIIKMEGIGKGIASHIDEIVKTGKLKSQEERLQGSIDRQVVLEKFLSIWGVGPKIANKWFENGYKDIEDLVSEKLTKQQKVGIKYYSELKLKIPKDEAINIFLIIKKVIIKTYPKAKIEMVGSYRRGEEELGDIDIMVSLFPNQSSLELQDIITKLEENGIITDSPVIGEEKFMGVCALPNKNSIHRRIDIRLIDPSQWATSLLHSTGPAAFNIQLRQQASQLGYKLNERGLYKMSILDDGDELIDTKTEQDIFENLGMEYISPKNRI